MPYKNAPVPQTYEPSYLNRELQRVGEAFNVEEAFGGLLLSPLVTAPIALTLTTTPVKLDIWRSVTPNPTIGDGFVLTDPRIGPDNDLLILIPGVYMLSGYGAFEHDAGAYVSFEVYLNGARTFLGAIVDASQQSRGATFNFSGMVALAPDDVIELRGFTDNGSEDIDMVSATLQVFKLRDLRTRFS